MKKIEFNALMYDKNHTKIILPENKLELGNESTYYASRLHIQTKADEFKMFKSLDLNYSCLKKNNNDLLF